MNIERFESLFASINCRQLLHIIFGLVFSESILVLENIMMQKNFGHQKGTRSFTPLTHLSGHLGTGSLVW